MQRLMVILLTVSMAACTTLREVHEPAPRLQADLAAGGLLKAGDRVRLTTQDGVQHTFVVASVGNGVVAGHFVSIPIGEIVALEIREPSVGKSLLLVLGVAVGLVASKGYSETHHRNCSGGTIC